MKKLVLSALIYASSVLLSSAYAEDLGAFQVNDIKDLAHPVCTLRLASTPKLAEGTFHFAEGDICPVGGGNCTYVGIVQLNHKQIHLKRITKNHFKTDNIELIVNYKKAPCKKGCSDEGENVKAQLTLQRGQDKTEYELLGYCGI